MATKKSTRATRSKQETAQEFTEVQARVDETEPVPEGEVALRQVKVTALRSAAANFSLETAIQTLTSSGIVLTGALAELTKKLQDTARQVEELKEVKDLLVKDIEDLHGKEIATSAIEDLVAAYKTKEEELNKSLSTLQSSITFARQQAQDAWGREQAEHARVVQERDLALVQARRRDDEQYQYQKGQERARADKEFANTMADLKRTNDLRQADLERGWAARESELKARETELATLKARVDGIQAEIDTATKKEVAIVTNSISRDHKHAVEILTKDYTSKETVLNNKIETLTTQLAASNTVIAQLNAQLSQAQAKVAEIAGNALQAASGRQALAEVQSMMTAQGSNATKKA